MTTAKFTLAVWGDEREKNYTCPINANAFGGALFGTGVDQFWFDLIAARIVGRLVSIHITTVSMLPIGIALPLLDGTRAFPGLLLNPCGVVAGFSPTACTGITGFSR